MRPFIRHAFTGTLLAALACIAPLAQAQVDPCFPDYALTAIIGHPNDPHQTGVTLSYGSNPACHTARSVTFEISTDDATYVPLAGAPYVSALRQSGNTTVYQAIFSVGPAGTYYLRARLNTGDYVGPATVTAN